MKTIHEIRLKNLRQLVAEFGSGEKGIAVVAELAETAKSHLHNLLHKAPSYAGRGIGNALARKLENACNKASGWMDTDHNAVDPHEEELLSIFNKLSMKKQAELLEEARRIKKGKT